MASRGFLGPYGEDLPVGEKGVDVSASGGVLLAITDEAILMAGRDTFAPACRTILGNRVYNTRTITLRRLLVHFLRGRMRTYREYINERITAASVGSSSKRSASLNASKI